MERGRGWCGGERARRKGRMISPCRCSFCSPFLHARTERDRSFRCSPTKPDAALKDHPSRHMSRERFVFSLFSLPSTENFSSLSSLSLSPFPFVNTEFVLSLFTLPVSLPLVNSDYSSLLSSLFSRSSLSRREREERTRSYL